MVRWESPPRKPPSRLQTYQKHPKSGGPPMPLQGHFNWYLTNYNQSMNIVNSLSLLSQVKQGVIDFILITVIMELYVHQSMNSLCNHCGRITVRGKTEMRCIALLTQQPVVSYEYLTEHRCSLYGPDIRLDRVFFYTQSSYSTYSITSDTNDTQFVRRRHYLRGVKLVWRIWPLLRSLTHAMHKNIYKLCWSHEGGRLLRMQESYLTYIFMKCLGLEQ